MLVSTIIPAYNAAAFLQETLDSALAQTHHDQEIIVVDDGSTDATSEILARYGTTIRVIRRRNGGRAAACNTGVKAAAGEYIAFLDADDLWLPAKLETQLAQCGQYTMSYTDTIIFGPGLEQEVIQSEVTPQHAGDILEHLLLGNFITGSSVLLRRQLFLDFGGFDESYDCVQDWPLWLKIAAAHPIGRVAEPLVRYRLHDSATSRRVRRTLPAHRRVIADAFAPGGPGARFPHLRSAALANAYSALTQNAQNANDWWFSVGCAVRAVALQPRRPHHWKQTIKGVLGGLRIYANKSTQGAR